MKTQTEKSAALPEKEIFVKMALDAWQAQNERVDKFLEEISDEELRAETAPGKNSGVYLIGHLTAVADALAPLFGFGEKLYPELEEIFLKNPEDKQTEPLPIAELKKYRNEISVRLSEYIGGLSADDWFAKHTAVAAEDFARERHRNRLNVLLSRTIHHSYHLGQLNLLKRK